MATATAPPAAAAAPPQAPPAASSTSTGHVQRHQPAVDKVRQLLYRRLKVVLPSGRVIEGDLACLDRQGNLILSNAQEHIAAADAASQAPSSSKSSSKADKQQQQGGATPTPTTTQLGMVLVPKAQQQQVLLRVPSVSHELGGLSLSSGS